MTRFTICEIDEKDYDITGEGKERRRQIRRAVRQFLPHATSENLTQVRWHLFSEGCEERNLKPLSDLMTGTFVPDPEDMIHLHPPQQSDGQREHSTPERSQDFNASTENDEHENGNGGDDDGEDDNGEDNDGEDDDGEDNDGEDDNGEDNDGDNGDNGDIGGDGNDDQDNPPQPSIESMPTDPQTNMMDKHLAGDQLYIKIVYDLRGVPKISDKWLDVDNFPTEVLHFSRQRSLPDIFTQLAEIVSQRLKDQEKESYDNLNEKKMERFLLLRPVLIHNCPMKQRAFEFDDSGISRVAVVNDLLSATVDTEAARRGELDALDEQTRQPQLTIKLRLIDAVDQVLITDPLVVIRPGAKEKKTGGGARFYRIGSQVDPEAEEDRLVSLSKALFWRCKFRNDLTGLTILTANMWSLRGLDICNPDEGLALGKRTPHLKKKTNEAPEDTQGFERALENGSLRPHTDGRLLYNFKSWTSPDIIPGYPLIPLRKKSEKKLTVTVAIRYYSHLPFQEMQQLNLPVGDEIEFESRDMKPEVNHGVFDKQIRQNLGQSKNNSPLFDGRHEKSWKIDIWLMPQVPGGRTLFRFAAKDTLVDYLHKPFVANGDTTLFAEVHLCPKSSDKVTTRGGREIQKK